VKDRVLITGGTGFIGHALVNKLSAREQPPEIVAADLPEPRLSAYPSSLSARIARLRRERVGRAATVVPLDTRDADAVTGLVQDFKPNVVVHLAAVAVADDAKNQAQLTEEVNVGGLANVIDALAGTGARLVFVSSSFVYGDFETPVVDERHPLRPSGPYGETKFRGEQMVRQAGSLGGAKTVIIRPSAVYGPYDSNGRIIQKLIEEARLGHPATLRGADGYLDFTFVQDLAAGLELAAFHPKAPGRTFNLTAGKGRSLRELAAILKGYFPDQVFTEEPSDPTRPKRGTLDIGHAQFELGYEPSWDLESGVEEYLSFYRMLDETADQAQDAATSLDGVRS
jgi:nucleoside-diphosphate-sugar epimerase